MTDTPTMTSTPPDRWVETLHGHHVVVTADGREYLVMEVPPGTAEALRRPAPGAKRLPRLRKV